MSLAEAPFNNTVARQESRWTGREGISKLLELQGQTVNLLPVLNRYSADHVHWFPQTRLLEPTVSVFELEHLCVNFIEQNGIAGTPDPLYSVYSSSDILAAGIGVEPQDHWPAGKTLLFPWVDFQVKFRLSDKATEVASPFIVPYQSVINVNTARVEGSLYEIDIALGGPVPRDEQALIRIAEYGLKKMLGVRDRIDALVISEDSQQLVEALLAGRV